MTPFEQQGPEATAPVQPGEALRQAREARGISLSAVAQQLCLPERSLAAIEAGDFGRLPGHTFTRGYIRAYARMIGLDPERLVLEFDRYTGTDAKGSQVQAIGQIEEPVRLASVGLKLVSFVVLVALAGIAFYLWQERNALQRFERVAADLGHVEVEGADGTIQIHPLDDPAPESEPAPADVEAGDGGVVPDASAEPPPVAESPASEGEGTEMTTPADGTLASPQPQPQPAPPGEAPALSAPVAAPAAAPAEAAPREPVAEGLGRLELRFTADCWTRVTDAQGRVLVSALMPAGSQRVVDGEPPLSLVLGFSRGVQVFYNGEAVDISRFQRGETARFQVGQ